MKNFCVIILMVLVSCTIDTSTVKQREVLKMPVTKAIEAGPIDYTKTVRSFLASCEDNLDASATVIAEKKLIKALSHLNYMGAGGTHYYLLEKEAISDMLHKQGAYTYSECYLVDANGKIVYTMYNEDLLGRKVSQYKTGPLMPMYTNGMKEIPMIIDVTEFPVMSKSYDIYFSRPVTRDGEKHGVLIAAIDIANLSKQLPASTKIVSSSKGLFRMHSEQELINTQDVVYTVLSQNLTKVPSGLINYNDGIYRYQFLSYKTISWVLVIPNRYVKGAKHASLLNEVSWKEKE